MLALCQHTHGYAVDNIVRTQRRYDGHRFQLINLPNMNKRRVHELMQANFPNAAPAHQVWLNIADVQGRLLNEEAQAVVTQPFLSRGIDEVLVQVRRKICGRISISQLMPYVALHLAEGHIRIADRAFSVFLSSMQTGLQPVGKCLQTSLRTCPVTILG